MNSVVDKALKGLQHSHRCTAYAVFKGSLFAMCVLGQEYFYAIFKLRITTVWSTLVRSGKRNPKMNVWKHNRVTSFHKMNKHWIATLWSSLSPTYEKSRKSRFWKSVILRGFSNLVAHKKNHPQWMVFLWTPCIYILESLRDFIQFNSNLFFLIARSLRTNLTSNCPIFYKHT